MEAPPEVAEIPGASKSSGLNLSFLDPVEQASYVHIYLNPISGTGSWSLGRERLHVSRFNGLCGPRSSVAALGTSVYSPRTFFLLGSGVTFP
jgi:hypothetical protein